MLYVKSSTLSPDLVSNTDSEGFYCTGDLARWVGDRIQVIGRRSQFLKDSSGKWQHITVFEQKIQARHGVECSLRIGSDGVIKVYLADGHFRDSALVQDFLERSFYREVRFQSVKHLIPYKQKDNKGVVNYEPRVA